MEQFRREQGPPDVGSNLAERFDFNPWDKNKSYVVTSIRRHRVSIEPPTITARLRRPLFEYSIEFEEYHTGRPMIRGRAQFRPIDEVLQLPNGWKYIEIYHRRHKEDGIPYQLQQHDDNATDMPTSQTLRHNIASHQTLASPSTRSLVSSPATTPSGTQNNPIEIPTTPPLRHADIPRTPVSLTSSNTQPQSTPGTPRTTGPPRKLRQSTLSFNTSVRASQASRSKIITTPFGTAVRRQTGALPTPPSTVDLTTPSFNRVRPSNMENQPLSGPDFPAAGRKRRRRPSTPTIDENDDPYASSWPMPESPSLTRQRGTKKLNTEWTADQEADLVFVQLGMVVSMAEKHKKTPEQVQRKLRSLKPW